MAGPAAAVAEAWDKVAVFVFNQLYDERKRAENDVSAPRPSQFSHPFFCFVVCVCVCVSHFALIVDLVPTIHGSERRRDCEFWGWQW